MPKAPVPLGQTIQRLLAPMPEGRMTEVVGKGERLAQGLVQK